jgi:sugar/nucleoside kinase (ribokinase family)
VRELRSEFNIGRDLSPDDIPSSYLEAGHFHIAAMPPWQQRPFVEFVRGELGARLSIDTIEQFVQGNPEEVVDNLEKADLVFLNRQEYETLRENNLLHRLRNKEIILKRGSEGAIYINKFVPEGIKGEETINISAPHVDVIVDKSGAGDVLAGVFLALFIRGATKETALREAVSAASASLEGRGAETLLERCFDSRREFC